MGARMICHGNTVIRAGRAHWLCIECGKDVSLALLFATRAGAKFIERTPRYYATDEQTKRGRM